jgi:choline-sulfatase
VSAGPPNVLLLLSDEHSFRCLGHADAETREPVRTPTLDRLAETGTSFQQAYCQVPLCTPSRISLLTGRHAARCGAWDNRSVLAADLPTLPGAFAAAGYTTCLVGKMHLGGDRQFCGFQHRPYGDLTGAAGHQADPPAKEHRHPDPMTGRVLDAGVTGIPESLLQEQVVARETIAFLREQRHADPDRPWLLCASFSRPHFPLTAPRRHFERYWPDGVTPPRVTGPGDAAGHPAIAGMTRRFQLDEIDADATLRGRAAYFACVDYLDEVLGDLLSILERDGLLENTIVVYTSDHGELAGEHGLWWKQSWHEASTRVPLLVQTPGQRSAGAPAQRVSSPVALADLFPTLCAFAEVPAPAGLDGTDLSAAVTGGAEPSRGPVISDKLLPSFGAGTEFRMVRDGDYKYVGFRDAPELLFDLRQDPLEQRNLALEDEGRHHDALVRLRALVEESIDFEAAAAARASDEAARSAATGFARGTGNVFVLPDGRLIDADTTLYHPTVLAEDAASVFADWPQNGRT